jgi:flagellar protein FlgJ
MRLAPPIGVAANPWAAKAWKTAQDFEAQFLKSMLEQAFQGLDGEGPLGSAGPGAEAWRGFLIEEHARSIAARGGVGVAGDVYRTIVQLQGRTTNVSA